METRNCVNGYNRDFLFRPLLHFSLRAPRADWSFRFSCQKEGEIYGETKREVKKKEEVGKPWKQDSD